MRPILVVVQVKVPVEGAMAAVGATVLLVIAEEAVAVQPFVAEVTVTRYVLAAAMVRAALTVALSQR